MTGAGRNISSKVAVVAITAALYAVAKGLTSFIPTPWGVGQFLPFVFIPAFFAVISDTFSVAVGAGIGTFLGDAFFLTSAGITNPFLSLIAGVPANFVAFLLFGWLVKRSTSWREFIAAVNGTILLGNLIASSMVVVFGPYVFLPIASLISSSLLTKLGLVLGLTVFWSTTMVPFTLLAVPPLLRAIKPLAGRSTIVAYYPNWSDFEVSSLLPSSLAYAALFVLLGLFFFLTPLGDLFAYLRILILVTAASIAVLGPVAGLIAGSHPRGG